MSSVTIHNKYSLSFENIGGGRGGEGRLKREQGLNNFLTLKGGGGLNNFFPLKRGGTYLAGGEGLIEDIWYRDIHICYRSNLYLGYFF